MSASAIISPAAEAAGIPRNGLQRFGQVLMAIGAWPGKISSWLILPILVCVLAAVVGGLLRMSQIFDWGFYIPVLGTQLSMIGLVEMQWHLFAIMVMLGGAYTLKEDRHVRVDMLYANVSPKTRASIDAIGDLVLLLPFCAIIAWLSLRFVSLSFASGEQSDYNGLVDRYLVKSFVPIGLALLFVTGFGRVLRNIGFLLSRQP